jgi:hypothetical protein
MKVKTQPTEWDKMFANYVFDGTHVSRMYICVRVCVCLNRHFFKEDI